MRHYSNSYPQEEKKHSIIRPCRKENPKLKQKEKLTSKEDMQSYNQHLDSETKFNGTKNVRNENVKQAHENMWKRTQPCE
jgi:hypothetical protein